LGLTRGLEPLYNAASSPFIIRRLGIRGDMSNTETALVAALISGACSLAAPLVEAAIESLKEKIVQF
jgi:hypothetical protein